MALAEGKAIISLFWTRPVANKRVADFRRDREYKDFTAKDKTCHFATATIIALALHCMKSNENEEDKEDRRMVSELLALSLPSTMQNFCTFCKSPFMKFSDIPNLSTSWHGMLPTMMRAAPTNPLKHSERQQT